MQVTEENLEANVNKFVYFSEGKVRIVNPELAVEKKRTYDEIKEIIEVRKTIEKLLSQINLEDNLEICKKYASAITELDYKLQDLWGFERDESKHIYLKQSPKCRRILKAKNSWVEFYKRKLVECERMSTVNLLRYYRSLQDYNGYYSSDKKALYDHIKDVKKLLDSREHVDRNPPPRNKRKFGRRDKRRKKFTR